MRDSDFIKEYKLDPDTWCAAKIDKEALLEIEHDFNNRLTNLRNSAIYFANALQTIPSVHSVRWRIKDPKHLIRKIIRKRAIGASKYMDISKENYHEVVTDLIGIRAIHLFKEDLRIIDSEIRSSWDIREIPTIYIREGDDKNILIDAQHEVEIHEFGYRSAHYLIESKPSRQSVVAELQVRTIFEEGWSEIDHNLRYPDHSDNPDLKSVLTLFNRIAGSADEIASFTLRLKESIENTNIRLGELTTEAEQAKTERDASFARIDSILKEQDNHKIQNAQHLQWISQLKSELNTMKTKNDTVAIQLDPTQVKNPAQGGASQTGTALLAALAAWAVLSKQ